MGAALGMVAVSKPTCSRCGVTLHGNAETMPHLCADIEKRHARRKRQVDAVKKSLSAYFYPDGEKNEELIEAAATEAVSLLVKMGVADD